MTHNTPTAAIPVRFLAFFIDFLLMGTLIVAFLFVSMGKTAPSLSNSGDDKLPTLMDKYQFFAYFEPLAMDPKTFAVSVVSSITEKYPVQGAVGFLLIPWVWFALMESVTGGSPGKLATGIRVRRKDYGKAGLGVTTVRFFAKILSTLILFLGYIIALFDRKRQSLHDKIANTLVVKK